MKTQNKETGRLGEDMAAKFLEAKGYKILDRNYSTRFGELDIIALDLSSTPPLSSLRRRAIVPFTGRSISNTLVFIEVKTKTSDQFGSPEEMITPHKLHQIQNTAQSYLLSHPTSLCHSCPLCHSCEGRNPGPFRMDPCLSRDNVQALHATPLLRIDAICINLETKTIKHYENLI